MCDQPERAQHRLFTPGEGFARRSPGCRPSSSPPTRSRHQQGHLADPVRAHFRVPISESKMPTKGRSFGRAGRRQFHLANRRASDPATRTRSHRPSHIAASVSLWRRPRLPPAVFDHRMQTPIPRTARTAARQPPHRRGEIPSRDDRRLRARRHSTESQRQGGPSSADGETRTRTGRADGCSGTAPKRPRSAASVLRAPHRSSAPQQTAVRRTTRATPPPPVEHPGIFGIRTCVGCRREFDYSMHSTWALATQPPPLAGRTSTAMVLRPSLSVRTKTASVVSVSRRA